MLCSGKVTPDGALLFSSCLYIAVLIIACTLPDSMLRLIIALSAAATLAYTPFLKRLTGLKNLTVAFIIAASPLAGALATGLVCCPCCETPAECALLRHPMLC
jgi:4-hydroxybenzoate polyprenyltransferase